MKDVAKLKELIPEGLEIILGENFILPQRTQEDISSTIESVR